MVAEHRLRSGTAPVGLVTSWRNSVEIDSSRVSMRSSMEQAKYPYRSIGWLYEYVSRKSCVPITYTRGDGNKGRAAGSGTTGRMFDSQLWLHMSADSSVAVIVLRVDFR